MGKLSYLAITSLDGYVTDRTGGFSWAEPDEEVHAFANALSRQVGAELYGRKMYEVMHVWQTLGDDPEQPDVVRDYADAWKTRDKIVYSSTLDSVWTPRTELRRTFDADEVRRIVTASDLDVSVSGPTLAAAAIRAGVVDEYQLIVNPVVVGAGGVPAFADDLDVRLNLVEERRFARGVVYLRYRQARESRGS